MALKYDVGERIPLNEHTAGELALHFSNAREVLQEETATKAKVSSKRGRKIGANGRYLTFAYDLLSPADKRKYTKGSPLVTYNMNEVMSLNSFKMLETKKQKELMEYWLNNEVVTKGQLKKAWNISYYKFSQIYNPLNVAITNPKLMEQMDRIKHAHAAMTPEKKAESVKKSVEKKSRKALEEKERLERAKYEAMKAQEQVAAAEPVEVVEPVKLADTVVTPTFLSIVSTTSPATSRVYPLPLELGFNIANRSGDDIFDWTRKVLAFLQGDNATYKISISIEEVKS